MTLRGSVMRAAFWVAALGVFGPPSTAAAQGSVHRPWVGVGAGLGGVLGNTPADGTDGLLASSVEVPLTPRDGVRFSAERLWSSVEDYGGLSLRQFSVDLIVRKYTGRLFGCATYTLLGLGPGIYSVSLESAQLPEATRVGYQLTVGQECIRSRVATGGAFGFRFVKMPEHPAFANAVDVAMTLSLSLRIRL